MPEPAETDQPLVAEPVKLTALQTARQRIADCLQLDEQGRLVQRRDYLNLAGLGLTDADLAAPFTPGERGLPEISLASLPHLRYLDLTGNQLTALPECVTGFTDLVWLGLNFNQLEALPESIGALAKLQRLYLRGNALAALPEGVGNLKALLELDLTGCQLARLPAAMGRLEALEHIALEEAVLSPDLRAAWKEKGWASLRAHLARVAAEASLKQFVGKVVLVGSQENGKTCLQRALRGERFIEGLASTDGMSRERLHLRLDGGLVSPAERGRTPGPRADVIDLTLWDMGGQQSYQHTHQMFFTPSAVYLLVTLPRRGGSIQELDQWIELVKKRTAGEATIIVVSTACKDCPLDRAITLTELQKKHGEMIRALAAVDSKDRTGIPDLRKLLAQVVQEPRAKCSQTWLPGWARVLNALAERPEAFLRWSAVRDLCEAAGVQDPAQQRQVIRTGHLTGSLLWREDIPAGEDVVILNPDWLCRAVARLLDDPRTKADHGLVATDKLERVWRGPGRDGTPGYEPDTYPALIELMEINELVYRPRLARGSRIGEGRLLLVTQMVEDLPRQDVDKTWEQISPPDGAETVRVVAFRRAGSLGYEVVQDLVYLLIFRLREFSLGRADYRQAVHWQRGLLVTDDYGSAGRIELEEDRLRITVRHQLGDGLMHSIVHRIGVRDDAFWSGRGLERVEFVPCGKACAVGTPDQGLISMEDCVEARRMGDRGVKCETCHRRVLIADLLGAQPVLPPDLRAVLARLAELEANLTAVVRAEGGATREEIASLRRFIQMQGDGILDAFTSEWKDGPRLFSLVPIPGKAWNPRSWTQMDFRVTAWCEASRKPVPLFGELKPGTKEPRGSEVITLTREWVAGARKALKWGSLAAFAVATGGAGAIGGLVSATGGVISPNDAKALAEEFANQQQVFKEVLGALPEGADGLPRGGQPEAETDREGDPARYAQLGYGVPTEEDKRLIRYLRAEFEKRDPTWGGLEPRNDGKFGRIWAHPLAKRAGEH